MTAGDVQDGGRQEKPHIAFDTHDRGRLTAEASCNLVLCQWGSIGPKFLEAATDHDGGTSIRKDRVSDASTCTTSNS